MANKETLQQNLSVSIDPNPERNITIRYEDLRPQNPIVRGKNFIEMLEEPVEVLEMFFKERQKFPEPFHSIFFGPEGLENSFEDARLASQVAEDAGKPFDLNSVRLVRYTRKEAEERKILGGYSVIG